MQEQARAAVDRSWQWYRGVPLVTRLCLLLNVAVHVIGSFGPLFSFDIISSGCLLTGSNQLQYSLNGEPKNCLKTESSEGSIFYAYWIIMVDILASSIQFLLYELYSMFYGGTNCSIGFSGILFAILTVICNNRQQETTSFFGFFSVPSKWFPWLILLFIELLSPGTSFVGHLSGILVGLLYVYRLLNLLIPSRSTLVNWERWEHHHLIPTSAFHPYGVRTEQMALPEYSLLPSQLTDPLFPGIAQLAELHRLVKFEKSSTDLVKTFPVKRTEPKVFDELPVSKLLNYLTRDNIIELIGFPNFSSLNEQVRQQTGKVSLPAVKKMLADNEQFQAILDQNHGMIQQAYNKYLAANTKVNDLTRQQQSKQISWLMNKPKKQFLGCMAKHTPPEVFQKCVEQYDDPDAKYEQYKIIPYSGLRNSAYEKELNAGHTNRAAVLRPPPGMKIQHLPKGIREYVSRNPSEFKDYLDEISAETKYLSTISRLVKKETGPDARDRIRRRILQAAENTGDDSDVDVENE
ncbi:hypothetical protein PROFUN_16476 [Planoprotostelium fungivorum]|uniref:Peptidase S54 rhomboid domain-containing protein n=1 Tax=Planoprotostelium fungivorum TaxID=1890364 RepID=A0A2P6MQC1_9EUKA|nr:hypothetical protein PROFUN_16476 [Planoprotostelium fungivorum]